MQLLNRNNNLDEQYIGEHTVAVIDKPFYGYITRGAATFAPDFRSLRANESEYLFALLDDDLCGGSLTINSPEIQALKNKECKDQPDLSHEVMPEIIEVALGEGKFYELVER